MHRIDFFLNYNFEYEDSATLLNLNEKKSWHNYNIKISRFYRDRNEIKNNWEKILKNENLQNSILHSSFWNRPLYIGQARNIANRINDHLKMQTDFSNLFQSRAAKFNYNNDRNYNFSTSLEINNLLVSFTELDFQIKGNRIFELDLLEKILQVTTNPNLSQK